MTDLQKGILTLIRSAITQEASSQPAGFIMTDAYPVIMKHQIITLAYEGAVLCGVSKAAPEMQKLFGHYCRCLLQSERQLRAIENICTAFQANEIDHMPLKGCNMKHLYPKPELRLMGDADILVRTSQYDKIRPIVAKMGFSEQTESDHEYIWQSPALFLELHKRLIPSYNKDYFRYFGDGWKLAKKQEKTRYAMSPEDEFIFNFCHFAKHYRDGGIGLRHAADLWVFLRANPNLNENYLHTELHKLQLLDFYRNIRTLLGVWFEGSATNKKTDFMTDFLFACGVWGQKDSHEISKAAKSAHVAGSVKKGKLWQLLQFIFPGKIAMQHRYPILRKCPILLPILWPVRWVTAVLFRRKNIRTQQNKLKIATTENIESYQAALNYVGLDFHFKE